MTDPIQEIASELQIQLQLTMLEYMHKCAPYTDDPGLIAVSEAAALLADVIYRVAAATTTVEGPIDANVDVTSWLCTYAAQQFDVVYDDLTRGNVTYVSRSATPVEE